MHIISQTVCQVNHLVPAVYQRLVDLVHALERGLGEAALTAACGDLRAFSGSLSASSSGDDLWAEFISRALLQPTQHRGRYQALNMLLPKIGASRFLSLQPGIIESLLSTPMRSRDISSSVSSFLATLVYALLKETEAQAGAGTGAGDECLGSAGLNKFGKPIYPNRHGAIRKNKEKFRASDINQAKISMRSLWAPHIVRSLCSPHARQRINSADYLLANFLEFDPHAAAHLMDLVRGLPCAQYPIESKLWGLVNIVLKCRVFSIQVCIYLFIATCVRSIVNPVLSIRADERDPGRAL